MKACDALKLREGDEVVDKVSGEVIRVACVFEDVIDGKKVVMIEGVGVVQGYNHWRSTVVK